MKEYIMTGLLATITSFSWSQHIGAIINTKEVERIEKILSADDMQGRKTFTPGIEKAASFITGEFKDAGLQPLNGSGSYLQAFTMVRPKLISASVKLNGNDLEGKNVIILTSQPVINLNDSSGLEIVSIKTGANFFNEAIKYAQAGKSYLVLVDTSFSKNFHRLEGLKKQIFLSSNTVVFLLTSENPVKYQIAATHEITESKLANVVGMLPGKSRKEEYVIFSGHYDHLGIGKPVNGDSIYNGANDDASGITAVIMLAKYFKALGNNERTIVFAAFTAEEVGGFGSQYFSRQIDASKIIAMFNIEMIGTLSKWGENSAYITGYEKTNMGKILERNLETTAFRFYPDPYPEEQLFFRSDNATLARLGVPAHSISTSKMDNEPQYHKVSDELGTLDIGNMTMIIKAIALSANTIVQGKDSPSRLNTDELR